MRHAARAHTVTHPAQRDAFETPHPQRQRATRFDVARPAGVSTAVVSYVLNGSPKIISPDTAQRVFDAARCAVNAALDPAHTPDMQLIAAELVTRQSCGCK